ncbi:MAG TPA: hypothetical protein ENK96_09525 [Desulfobulbaceae bacterium]|nr:hypothetical protein [Desulfobulbaceae bacterium]
MKTPFEILNIPGDSGDDAVKKGYLAMVKQFPPERFPDEFQRICSAYEMVKTEKNRLKYALFDAGVPDVDELIRDIKDDAQGDRPDLQTLQKQLLSAVHQTMIVE